MWAVRRPPLRYDRHPPPPFNAPAARRMRAALGLDPDHVAHALRASYDLPYVTPALVAAWERGNASPSLPELTALAGALWCSPGELIGRPRTLREHRMARGLAPEDVAHTVGLELHAYLRMEETGQWRGTERQTAALTRVLGLSLADVLAVTGREERLAELLRNAVTTRWQAYVRPVSKLAPLDRRLLEEVLHGLHQDYQAHMAATLTWGGGPPDASNPGRDFLTHVVDHFWTAVAAEAD
ncbi:helix-turn-helix transcriptional regulator [Streptomyces sp. AC04842]|uniref:helix-turn-helix domain-containing protein n=1 Tax=Streptomyces sp. AC04842 TaxID=2775327 RepID=UPI0020C673CC|nr:helix-turn-helix transcriptional regulator [Streptomyces sp. AC04842]